MARYDFDGCPSDAWLLGFYHEEPEEPYECDAEPDDDFYPDPESIEDKGIFAWKEVQNA